jgi:uncharacterized membrane protein YkvA (DUF1232 family)
MLARARRRAATQLRVGRALLRHDRTPRVSKALLAVAAAYAVMPFDLVPDWIPILGQLDDVVVIGILVWVAWRLVPEEVRRECRVGKAAT